MAEPGPLVGRGRAADVFDIGGGRVLRRYRPGHGRPGLVALEAEVMRHVAAHGFPVPAVHDVDGGDLVMDRLDGPSMLDDLARKPWRVGRHADLWAALVRRLSAVPVDDLASSDIPIRFGAPTAVLHLDLHPDNIMLTPSGAVVIDWSNASLGPADAEVAQSWLVAGTATVDGVGLIRPIAGRLQRRLVDRFVDRCGRGGAIAMVPVVAELKLADRNVRPEEAARIRALVASLS